MTSVTMVANDSAALHTTKKTDSRDVKEVQGYPASQSVKEHEDTAHAPQKNPKKTPQRRKQKRRQKDQSVLLDTRSGHDRRNVVDAKMDEPEDNDKENTGIDIYT